MNDMLQGKRWFATRHLHFLSAAGLSVLFALAVCGTARGQELLMRTPMGRFGQTHEVAGAALYLASDAASFVSGQTIAIDGGFLASGVNQ